MAALTLKIIMINQKSDMLLYRLRQIMRHVNEAEAENHLPGGRAEAIQELCDALAKDYGLGVGWGCGGQEYKVPVHVTWSNQVPGPQDLAGNSEEYFWVRGGHFNRPVLVRVNNGVTSEKTEGLRAYRPEANFSFFTEGYPDYIWASALHTWPGLTGLEWAGPVPRPTEQGA